MVIRFFLLIARWKSSRYGNVKSAVRYREKPECPLLFGIRSIHKMIYLLVCYGLHLHSILSGRDHLALRPGHDCTLQFRPSTTM